MPIAPTADREISPPDTRRAYPPGVTEVPAALRREVRLLGRLLGRVLEESGGAELLGDVERLRTATIALRRDPTDARREHVVRIVEGFGVETAERVARAFTCYFQLINIAEEHQRVRTLRERAHRSEEIPDSIASGVAVVRETLGAAGAIALAERLDVSLVLTAHPTEARRRAVVEAIWRIGALLERLDDPRLTPADGADVERRLLEEITSLWRTDPVRGHGIEPLDEVRVTLALFDETIFRALPVALRELDESLAEGSGARPPVFSGSPLRWGSWVGADRDGNPSVTPDVTRAAAKVQTEHVLLGLEAAARRIARSLSASERETAASIELLIALAADEQRFPEAARELMRKLPDAPHRRKLALAAHRLAATRTGSSGGYRNGREFSDDVSIVQRSLAAAGAMRLAYGEIQHLLWQSEAFGFHLASLEVRQHASVHARAVEELTQGPARVSAQTRELLETFRAIADVQHASGVDACRRYVVSFTRSAEDLQSVFELARAACPDGAPVLDVVPLFESRADLERAVGIMEELADAPDFSEQLRRDDGRVEAMLGYSDSAKELGMLAANLALHEAQSALAEWGRRRGLRLTLFHGRGGALGRGGGPTNRAILGQAPGSVDGRFKVTEQGEVAFARYGNVRIAERHLEQLLNAVLIASTPQHEAKGRECLERFRDTCDLMSKASEHTWRDLVERPGFAGFFARVTPMDAIEAMQIGSRPARRKATRSIADLRAIPWVFAWSQSRVNLPGWYGLGTGLSAAASRPGGLGELRAMRAEWPFFSSLMENAELSLAKADLPVAELYLEMGGDPAVAGAIEEELVRTTEMVLAITGNDAPLAGRPVLRRAIDLRNPYVDALSFLQVRFLRELRAGNTAAERLVHVTVNGLAAGLQNTG